MHSKTCEYAIRAMIYVAQHSGEGSMVNIKEISRNIGCPELFVGKILQSLTKKGLISSAKGRHGGFYIDENAAKASLADIVIAIDGDKIFTGCGIGLDYCSEKRPCPIHNEFKKARSALFRIYADTKLNHFKASTNSKEVFLKRK